MKLEYTKQELMQIAKLMPGGISLEGIRKEYAPRIKNLSKKDIETLDKIVRGGLSSDNIPDILRGSPPFGVHGDYLKSIASTVLYCIDEKKAYEADMVWLEMVAENIDEHWTCTADAIGGLFSYARIIEPQKLNRALPHIKKIALSGRSRIHKYIQETVNLITVIGLLAKDEVAVHVLEEIKENASYRPARFFAGENLEKYFLKEG